MQISGPCRPANAAFKVNSKYEIPTKILDMQVMTFPVNSACKLDYGSSDSADGDEMMNLDESVSCHDHYLDSSRPWMIHYSFSQSR